MNTSLSEQERKGKMIDYFILIRNSQKDKEVTEAHLEDFLPGIDPRSYRPIISGQMNEEGAKRLLELTTENKPDEDGRQIRTLAIIIQGKVFTIPTLRDAIGAYFQISGDFTQDYVDEVVRRVRNAGR